RSARHRDLHSFPTRRSSDLLLRLTPVMATVASAARGATQLLEDRIAAGASLNDIKAAFETWAREESRRSEERLDRLAEYGANVRSEEHTSELQSRSDLVCRL